MSTLSKQTTSKIVVPVGKQRSYGEIIEFLDKHWTTTSPESSIQAAKKLDKSLGSISQKIRTVVVTGTNGKSLTAQFTAALLKAEGLMVGALYTPHILTYNERIHLDNETIPNKKFTEVANDIINTTEADGLILNTAELLAIMALNYFYKNETDVIVIEVEPAHAPFAASFYTPYIAAITRITTDTTTEEQAAPQELIQQALNIVKSGTHVVSADQSKANLQVMSEITKKKGGLWDMPIRKLAPLEYPFEQLHGRCAALAERISRIYINAMANKDTIVVAGSLLSKQKGRRGRPTLEAKRQSELNPKKTLEQFWRDVHTTLPGRFQLLDKEKPTLLLDNASNLDALKNLLLGIRLLHYQKPLKGLSLVIGCDNPAMDTTGLLKLLRYFFKKTSGSVIFCSPTMQSLETTAAKNSWDPEEVVNATKAMKIKAKAVKNFKEAFRLACKSVDERHGLVVITGSSTIVSEYWRQKGVKKF